MRQGNATDYAIIRGDVILLRTEIEIEQPHAAVWEQVRDLPRFGTIDPLHRRILILGPRLEQGVEIAILHGLLGVSFYRYGRILQWDEGKGYAFSDLSVRGFNTGFPHVFFIEVVPVRGVDEPLTRLTIRIQGRWTASWMPMWLRRIWLTAICTIHRWLLRRAFRVKNGR